MNITIVALSGGSDSVALLHYLLHQPAQSRIVATHCNFHLRGEESMRDQHFCEELCRRLGVELLVHDFDTHRFMAEEHLSLELAARRQRYAWWDELAAAYEADGHTVQIAVGHHRDDSIETMLFHLMRGTGIKGLTGIPSQNGRIIRPLSTWSRHDILDYIDRNGLSFVTDSSNLLNEAMRNQIRNLLLPLMEQINPNARTGMANTMRHLSFTDRMAEERLQQIFSGTVLCRADNITWHEFTLPDELLPDAGNLFHHWAERFADADHTPRIHGRKLFYTEPSPALLATQQCTLTEQLLPSTHMPPFSPHYELFDADTLSLPLTYRHWQEADRIQPLGMKQTKLVSDLFTNAHYSPVRKATAWIVSDADGRILSVAGLRVADWCKITSQTRNVLCLRFEVRF